MENIIITGASSGIGSHLSKFLKSAGYNVINFDLKKNNNSKVNYIKCNLSNLKSIEKMKAYGLDVAYGHHCGDVTAIFMALCYNPSDLLFYVKGSPDFQYTEDNHAIQIDQIQDLIKKIHRYNDAVGTGIKMSMNNKIENPE